MENDKIIKIILALALAGALFSGYLTFSRLLSGSCPLREPCPVVLGIPACVYGFAMFSIILLLGILGIIYNKYNVKERDEDREAKKRRKRQEKIISWVSAVSGAGVLFALYTSVKDLFFTPCPGGSCAYSLGLPSCVYGLLVFIAVFVLSRTGKRNKKRLDA